MAVRVGATPKDRTGAVNHSSAKIWDADDDQTTARPYPLMDFAGKVALVSGAASFVNGHAMAIAGLLSSASAIG